MADAAAVFRRPFAEQVAAFRLKLADLRPTRAWTDLWQAEHDRAFMVAGALKADLLADLAGAVQRAIEDGTGIERFRAEFRKIVEQRGWHGWTGEETKRGQAWRTKVIYKTNMATTYAAGRWAQLMKAGYPLLVYRHGGSLDPRPEHLSWDGLILPVDHPFWATHAPPNGWGCSCFVIGARSERDAVRKGGKPGKRLPDGWAVLNPKTGAPHGIDRGWAYAPGASVAEAISQLAAKLPTLPPRLGLALRAATQLPPDPIVTEESRVERVEAAIAAVSNPPSAAVNIVKIARTLEEPRLSHSEKAIVFGYTTSAFYDRLNRYLRDRAVVGPDADFEVLAEMLIAALAKLPAYKGVVRRGFSPVSAAHFESFLRLQEGDAFALGGFTSTAYDPSGAFGGTINLVIATKTGRKIDHLSAHGHEKEVLLRPGLKFKVVKRIFENGTLTLELRELSDRYRGKLKKDVFFVTDLAC